jgi:hypothetical protein
MDHGSDILQIAIALRDGEYYVTAAGKFTGYRDEIGPFETEDEAKRACADLSEMLTQLGSTSVPLKGH